MSRLRNASAPFARRRGIADTPDNFQRDFADTPLQWKKPDRSLLGCRGICGNHSGHLGISKQ
jgi:hypothetical protein